MKEQLFEIISDVCNYDKDKLYLEMEIFKDLGCAGDDAYNLVEKICIEFQIDCTEFYCHDVCDSEFNNYKNSVLNPIYLYTKLTQPMKVEFPSFTIQHLLDAIQTKRLKSHKKHGFYYAVKVST